MVKIKFRKKTLFLLNIFLTISVVINMVLILRVYQSQQDFVKLSSLYDEDIELGFSMSQNRLSSTYTPLPQSMCQSQDCVNIPEIQSTKIGFYSEKIIIDSKIRAAAINAISSTDSEYHNLCDRIKDENPQTSFGSTYCREAVSLYYWLRDNIGYVTGPLGGCDISDVCQNSITTLDLGAGKCDEQAVLLVSLLRSVGIDCWVVLVNTDMTFDECLQSNCTIVSGDHAIVLAQLEGIEQLNMELDYWHLQNNPNTIFLDPTCKSCEFGQLPELDENRMVWIV